MRAGGSSLGTISDWLYENKIPSPAGKDRWSRETISKLLKNEKYTGDVMLQKTFVKDLFSGKQIKNNGELERYLIQEHHPAIVNRELFDRANKSFIVRNGLFIKDTTHPFCRSSLPNWIRFAGSRFGLRNENIRNEAT